MDNQDGRDFSVVTQIISLLEGRDSEEQLHILTTVLTWLKLRSPLPSRSTAPPHTLPVKGSADLGFSEREEMDSKQFLLEKEPQSDTERIACLAYYLTHYRDITQFKPADLTKLNTESAQREFSNVHSSAKNALRDGFLAAASKARHRQLSAMGEQYVNALPDREAARAIRTRMRPKRPRRTKPSASARRTAK